MFDEYKTGYCKNCLKNVPHERWIGPAILRKLDRASYQILRLVRIGPWHCLHCQRKCLILPPARPDAVDYHTLQNASGKTVHPRSKPSRPNNSNRPNASKLSQRREAPAPDPDQPVGNFLKTDESLVMRNQRLSRYSEKYRDAIVKKILTGTSSMVQVRRDMDVTEAELVDWMADLFDRMQTKLDALEFAALNRSSGCASSKNSQEMLPGFHADGPTIDGQSKAK